MFSMLAKGKQGVIKIDSASVRSSRHTAALTAPFPCICPKVRRLSELGSLVRLSRSSEGRHSRFALASMVGA